MPLFRVRSLRKRTSLLSLAVACGLLITAGTPARAQLGGGQTGGQTGGGQTGGGLGSGGQTGGLGQGGAAGGLAGGLQGPELMTFGTDIDATGGTGFAGRGNAAENFVGGLVQGQGQTGFGNARTNNQFAAINRQGAFNRQFQQPTGPSRSERIRPRHRIAFNYATQQTEVITGNLRSRIGSLPTTVEGVSVDMNLEGVATLRGAVADDHSARLAAALARLEPGVRGVDNQLTIAAPEPAQP